MIASHHRENSRVLSTSLSHEAPLPAIFTSEPKSFEGFHFHLHFEVDE